MRCKAPTKDRADVRVGHRAHHLLFITAGGLVGLDEHQAVHQLLLRWLLGLRWEQLGQLRPQRLLFAVVVIEALARLLADAALLLAHHGQHGVAWVLRHGLAFGFQITLGLCADVQRQTQRHFVLQGQRWHGHTCLQACHFDRARVYAFAQHGQAFHDISGKHARGVEAALVVDHDGGFANLQHIVKATGERFVRGLLTHDDLDQRHLVHGGEEVQADEVGGALARRGQPGDGQRRRVRGEHRILGNDGLGLLGALGLDGTVFKHRFDHQIAASQVLVGSRGLDAGQQLVALLYRAAASGHGLVQQALRIGLALIGILLRGVQQDDIDADLGRHIGNACTHHAGTQDAHLLDLALRLIFGARLALLDGVELVPKRVDDVLGHLRGDASGEETRLHLAGRVEVQQAPFEDGRHDVGQRRVVAVRLGIGHGRRNGQHMYHAGALAVATGEAEALLVPRLLGLGVVQTPLARFGQQLIACFSDVVDDAHFLGLGCSQLLALGDQLKGLLDANHAGQTLRPATTRQQAELHFGQPQLELGVVQSDAGMASQSQLQTAPQGRAVDSCDHRLAALFHAAHHGLEIFTQAEGFFCGGELGQLIDVSTHNEGGLGRGDDQAFDLRLFFQARHDGLEGLGQVRVEHVHGPAGHVDGDQTQAVVVDVKCDGHVLGLLKHVR